MTITAVTMVTCADGPLVVGRGDTSDRDVQCPSVLGVSVHCILGFEGRMSITRLGIGVGRSTRRDPAIVVALYGDAHLASLPELDTSLACGQVGDILRCPNLQSRRGIRRLVPAAVLDAELTHVEGDQPKRRRVSG